MKRQKRNARRNCFQFAKLEPRQLLAADLGALNLLANGDFSQVPTTSDRPNFFDSSAVVGWNATNEDNGQNIVLFTFDSDDGSNTVLKLDSTDDQIDNVFQEVATELGETYILSFDLRGQVPDGDVIIENVDVFWNDELVGTFESTGAWTTHAVAVNGVGGESRLEFREAAVGDVLEGDGVGVLIDNVNLAQAIATTGVTNGSFETTTGEGPFFSNGNVDGFSALEREGIPSLIQIQPNGQNGNAPATDGTNVLNLDTSSDVVDHVFADFDTVEGLSYFVTFDLFADGPQDNNTDEVRVRWRSPDAAIDTSQWIATITGNNTWQSYGFLVTGLGDLSRLELREPAGSPGDGSGALIDNVQLFSLEGVVNDLAVNVSESTDLLQGVGSANIASDLTLSHPSGENITGATVTITESAALIEDQLSVSVADSGISQVYDAPTGTLTLSGDASVATYQSVLQSLQYTNTSATPTIGNRAVSIVVSDSAIIGVDQSSEAASIDVNLTANTLALAQIATQTVEAGSPLFVTLDIDNSADVPLQFSAVSANESILTSRFETGDSFRLNISAPDAQTNGESTPLSGELTFQLFEEIYGEVGSRATDRIRTLANDGFYDGIELHRIIEDFVIQGGDPTGTGSGGSDLGDFDDQFNVLLQHNREGLLSFAKSLDDTNDSQFFITDGPTRSLDFNHTIFGVITSGEELREAIDSVDTGVNPNNTFTGDFPVGGVTIESAEIFQDNQHAALLLVAPEGVTGETTLTVNVQDANGNTVSQEITVNIVAPTGANVDSNPFLDDIPDLTGSFGVQQTFQLTAQDVENDNLRFLDLEQIETINSGLSSTFQIQVPSFDADDSFSYSVDIDTGLLTFTPGSAAESGSTVQFVVGVAQEARVGEPINNQNVDLQIITLTLS